MSAVAVDIGATKVVAARVSSEGELLVPMTWAKTPAHAGGAAVLAKVVEIVAHLRTDEDDRVAVSTAGVVDAATGRILHSTESIAGWIGTDLGQALRAETGLPVRVIGDGHAFGIGEAVYGSGAGCRTVVLIAVGTGVGGALVLDREAFLGARSVAGHFGHVSVPEAVGVRCPCGRTGHAEAVAGGAGILQTYRTLGGKAHVADTAALSALTEDLLAIKAIRLGGSAVGTLSAGLVNSLDPDVVVIAGGVSHAGGHWETAMREGFRASVLPAVADVPVLISSHGVTMALLGASHHAFRKPLR